VENNDTTGSAQVIDLGPGPGQDNEITITCSLSSSGDVDYFRFTAVKGDIVGAAAENIGLTADPFLSIRDSVDTEIVENGNGGSYYLYPPESPLPVHTDAFDSYVSLVAPSDGTYYVRITSESGAASGTYQVTIVLRRPAFEDQSGTSRQIIFVDFDGASIDAVTLFGSGNNPANLSPLSSFLPNWGLVAGDEDAVIDAILDTIEENFDDLRDPALNGNRPADHVPGHYDVEIRNSRDHAAPWGGANVSRLIIGGTITELGISTLGIAQHIDPGNFSRDDTAVILLDEFSGPSGPDSINDLTLDPSVTIVDAIGTVVGNVAAHEAGHYLGNWHQENGNTVYVTMDKGGNGIWDEAGVGTDDIFGTADDVDQDFGTDVYDSEESLTGTEYSAVRTAFGLSTGALGVVFVDVDNTSGIENGTQAWPYNTVEEGQEALSPGHTVVIMPGLYPENLILNKQATYVNEGGTVTIGN